MSGFFENTYLAFFPVIWKVYTSFQEGGHLRVLFCLCFFFSPALGEKELFLHPTLSFQKCFLQFSFSVVCSANWLFLLFHLWPALLWIFNFLSSKVKCFQLMSYEEVLTGLSWIVKLFISCPTESSNDHVSGSRIMRGPPWVLVVFPLGICIFKIATVLHHELESHFLFLSSPVRNAHDGRGIIFIKYHPQVWVGIFFNNISI